MTLPHFPLLPEAIPALWLPGKTQSPGSVHGCFSQPSFLESEAEATGDHSLPADPQPASWQSHHQAPLAFWNNNSQPKQRQNPAGATVCVCVCVGGYLPNPNFLAGIPIDWHLLHPQVDSSVPQKLPTPPTRTGHSVDQLQPWPWAITIPTLDGTATYAETACPCTATLSQKRHESGPHSHVCSPPPELLALSPHGLTVQLPSAPATSCFLNLLLMAFLVSFLIIFFP